MNTTLVTGFEAFGGSEVNSSELVVRALEELRFPGVATAVLPTSYRRAEAHIAALLHDHRPCRLYMLGLAQRSAAIRFEELALNRDHCAAPDNDGEIRLDRRIIEEAPREYRNSLQLDRMVPTARDLGEGVLFSQDAGGFVCNHVFFAASHLIFTDLPGCRCGFVHLPAVDRGDERLMRFVEIVQTWIIG